ncbi:MAG TPA: hypothetical protein VEH29_08125 [Acidimicrobiales bacterium]|nr:hypothetical protein [Acidimicrobiales bacterium]
MPVSGNEPASDPVEILSMTAASESGDGRIQLNVQLTNFPTIQGDRESKWLHTHLTHRIMQALDLQVITAGSTGELHIHVLRARLEESVRAIRTAVKEFNQAYPSVLAEYERKVDLLEAEKAARTERLRADQEVIDRVMSE